MEIKSYSFQRWNRTETDYPRHWCIHEIFEQHAASTPEAPALIIGGERWTYSQLNGRANQYAHYFRARGTGADSIVALMVDRSAETIAAILGVLKAGGAYAPLDINDPPSRIQALLDDLKPVTVVAELPPVENLPKHSLEKTGSPSSLAYVMFTSGSTGVPKGVMVEHRSVVRLVQNTNYVDFSTNDVFLQLAPLSFDASTFEIWGALLNGASLAVMPPRLVSLADLGRAIRQHSVTTMWLTAGLFHAMTDQQLESLIQVKQLLAGGDVLSPVHVRKFLDAAKNTRLINGYGPTEGTTFTCCYTIPMDHPSGALVPIGTPVSNTTVYLLDQDLQPVEIGATGELYVGGEGVARGYLKMPELTAEKFIDDPFSPKSGARMYRTGDLARYREDGVIEFLGRADAQVKLGGFRIEPGEIETVLNQHTLISQSAVVPFGENTLSKRLVAYVVPSNGHHPSLADLRVHLLDKLPPYMVPAQFVVMDSLPLNANGKVDRRALPEPRQEPLSANLPQSELERFVAEAWADELGISSPPLDQPFFDLGGSSLQLLRVQGRIERQLGRDIAVAELFRFPTIRSLAGYLAQRENQGRQEFSNRRPAKGGDIAIIGVSARLPGAKNVREFWENLKNGVESISFFSDEELEAGAGTNAVKARSILADADLFDAGYFNIFPKEAETIDPQHRIFLECSVEALEDAGCDPARYRGAIGVFAGCSPNTYFLQNLCADRSFIEEYTGGYQVANYQTMLGASPDFLSTRVSHKLNLTGPSITMGTACSTSLVAVTQACDSIRSGQCDVALAGGVSITFPQKRGYQYQEGGIVSPDGHCRAFDADAQGTVFGSGCAIVVLKSLDEAIADGDSIYAVIKGYGVNNDGGDKVGFTAPSVEGQAAAIRRAHQAAGVDPASISYVEAHGTGTPLGDPIEIAALTQAFGGADGRRWPSAFCAVGSAKTNVGHLDAAAGTTGLIKTALSLRHGLLPATLHFKKPNPRIDFKSTPFFVNDKLTEWKQSDSPRRAGVSAFGVGGTNAHVVLEEAPRSENSSAKFPQHVLMLSAKSETSLDRATAALADHLEQNPGVEIADVAYTLQTGRRRFEHRAVLVHGAEGWTAGRTSRELPVVFAFPGQGAQYPGMGSELYQSLPVFRKTVDECAAILLPHLGFDLRTAINADDLNQTGVAQPAIFTIEYALAKQWLAWGIRPQAMIGHSVGEFTAACLAGVLSLSDALEMVAARGEMMQLLSPGAMLSVRAPQQQLRELLTADLAMAAVNSPSLCVVAGSGESIQALEQTLTSQNIVSRKLRTSHAFHSPMVDPILEPLAQRFSKIRLGAPTMPYVSTLTGEWITAKETTNPEYWARHARETVQFSSAMQRLQKEQSWCVLEVGPGQALTTLTRQHGDSPNALTAVASMPDASARQPEMAAIMSALGRMWLCGIEPDWNEVYKNQRRRRISLPAYSFDRKRYWIEAPKTKAVTEERMRPVSTSTQLVKTPVSSPVSLQSRQDRLRGEIIALLEDLSGMSFQTAGAGTTFLDMGFDSLFLTQVTQSLESKYGVKIRFAQLLDDLATLERLASNLDSILPPDAPAVEQASIAAVADESGLQKLLQDQLKAFNELTARQLEMFKGAKAPSQPADPKVEAPKEQKFESFGPYKPVQKGITGAITPQQTKYLEAFIERYNSRTQGSKRLAQQHRAKLSDPRVAAGFRAQWKELVYPITIERSLGSKLWDVDGNEYIDVLNGFGVTMFGHCPAFVREAIEKQLQNGIEIGPQTPLAGKVAELLCELTGNDRATFCNTGSEAVMAAMRLARTVTNKKKIAFFTGDYHGSFDEVLVKATGRPGSVPRSRPIAPGIPDEKAANTFVLEYGSAASLEIIRAHAHELAAVLVEPVQSRHPNLQPVEFLRELRTITEQTNTALIFDEVVTGFRTHPGGMQALFGVRADLATYGKVIGGGLPVGVLAGKSKYMDALDGGMWQYGDDSMPEVGVTFFAGTFVRHPLAMASTWAVLNHLKDAGPQLQDELSEKTGRLVKQLNELFENGSVPARIENFRSIFYFGFPPAEKYASLLYYHLRLKGVHIQEGFPSFLTTAHTEADLDHIVRAFRDSIAEMQQGGFLPAPARALSVECEVPLTEAQMEIRLSAQIGDEESCSYNEGFSIRMRGPLNEPALRESLQAVVDRHEALRSTLTSSGEALRILPRVTLDVPLVELSEQSLEQLKDQDARTAFDLVHGPLIRAKLVRLSSEDHVLFITAHHIICDGWSVNIVLSELSELYTGKCLGRAPNLPEPMRFSEYAETQARQSVDPKIESYWVSEYSEPVLPLELPLDRARPALKSYRGDTFAAHIDAESYRLIKKAGAQKGSTLFGTLFSGFQALLSRLTGQTDVVVGVPAAAQSLLPGAVLVGHCVNFLPIRIKLEGDPKFSDFLVTSRRKLLDAYEHQTYTYGTLVRKLAIPRNPSRLPLIEVQFNLERVGGSLDFHGLTTEVNQSPKRFVNFDIFLNVVESANGLDIYCDYNTDLFDASTIARWIKNYETMLLGFVENAERPVSTLPLLRAGDQHQQIVEWNATAADYPRDKCFHQIFEEHAASNPGACAVMFEGTRLTYAELNSRSNQLAHWLRDSGVNPGNLVGVSIDPSIEMLIAILGVMKAGGAYVPLDSQYPADRIDFIKTDADLSLILNEKNWPRLEGQPETPLASVQPTDSAYVIYTSGSTGKPKGVEIPHRALMNFLVSMSREPGITATDKLLAVTTLSFDIAGLELMLPLLAGAQVVIAPRETIADGNALADLIDVAGITIMQATPTTWKLLLEAGWRGKKDLKILCGGEELTRDLANQLVPRVLSVWNMYGPTETTIWSSTCRVQGEGPVSIGRPIANTQLYVLDAQRQPVPVGVPGELYIGGDGLATGYWNRPELTAERFVIDPFSKQPSAKMYRTGDLARYLPDGNLICLGRLDNQVKIRGHRIELGEIESALLAQPTVRDAAAVVREDAPGEKRLAAYLIPSEKTGCDLNQLRVDLSERLPDYMIPSLFVAMDSLPLTPNGKIDRRALSQLPPPSSGFEKSYIAPRTDRERALAAICEQVLRIERVGMDDDLFALGADSIHLFQIASRAAREGLQLAPKQLLQNRTIGAVAAALDQKKTVARAASASGIVAVSRDKFRTKRTQ